MDQAGLLFDDVGIEFLLSGGLERSLKTLQDRLVLGAQSLEALRHRFGAADNLLLGHGGRSAYAFQLASAKHQKKETGINKEINLRAVLSRNHPEALKPHMLARA